MSDNVVVLETSVGEIELTLMPEVAPKACENFITHVKNGYYDGIIFHRVIPGFMIQGGDPSGNGTGGESIWGKEFEDECKGDVKFNEPGMLAMANRGPSTNGSQFFITTAETPWLHMKHTIFGKVTQGYDIVQKIESCARDIQDRPRQEKKILRAQMKSDRMAEKKD
ncbi:MAG: peptidylprolyl isomerase [Verrucomicrobia bacterium CG_4_10_14_3_um_filter_43_23]|nr:MAG: peptidylprolyl isomerase [Verrucomicrobia bacterium CG1_02_43_26]PIP59935.1 MAG: peptidylprolyl isomerase [Verrucomicrobia bacterium CG22_combo_CG10-13_8_21_14_all_43_17]PIX58155.1 MAG: peptidylprolyl isomerase [Verrucomicrobia bacterium CG_4_10_14_3_um_filter_43_23]PIY61846.1 MAG: peptidylprolyl isomerase [Verrucomicrobia bacterium CG_4_10_14_0_8_um_filter_43_34]PJA44467.1 MAG: peptidylprolyl isomerase [Verrucomicrobia bacterium CG_4_9_14_3_um_filter_43_20]